MQSSSTAQRGCCLCRRESRGLTGGGLWWTPWPFYGLWPAGALGIPAAKETGGRDVIAPNAMSTGSLLLPRGDRDGELCARRLSLQRALEHAGYGRSASVRKSVGIERPLKLLVRVPNRLASPCCHVTGVVARRLTQHTQHTQHTRPNINMKDASASVTTGRRHSTSTAARRV
jgi:hypothetical protein